jgi:hypothetical protein
MSGRARLAYGLGCIALGCYPIAISLGLIPIDESGATARPWVIAGAGFAFVIAGFMILLAGHSRINDLLAGVLLALLAFTGTWISLFGTGEGFAGGLPFLSRELNILVGRWVIGIGALINFALCVWAFRRAATGSR